MKPIDELSLDELQFASASLPREQVITGLQSAITRAQRYLYRRRRRGIETPVDDQIRQDVLVYARALALIDGQNGGI